MWPKEERQKQDIPKKHNRTNKTRNRTKKTRTARNSYKQKTINITRKWPTETQSEHIKANNNNNHIRNKCKLYKSKRQAINPRQAHRAQSQTSTQDKAGKSRMQTKRQKLPRGQSLWVGTIANYLSFPTQDQSPVPVSCKIAGKRQTTNAKQAHITQTKNGTEARMTDTNWQNISLSKTTTMF